MINYLMVWQLYNEEDISQENVNVEGSAVQFPVGVSRAIDDLITLQLGMIFEVGTVHVSFGVVPQSLVSVEITADDVESLWQYDGVQIGKVYFNFRGRRLCCSHHQSGFGLNGKYFYISIFEVTGRGVSSVEMFLCTAISTAHLGLLLMVGGWWFVLSVYFVDGYFESEPGFGILKICEFRYLVFNANDIP